MLKEFVVSEVNSLGHKNCGGMSHLGRYVQSNDQFPFAGIAGTHKVILIFTVFYLFFFSMFFLVNSLCHAVTEPDIALSATCTSWLLTINTHFPLTPTPTPLQKHVSCSSLYQKLINNSHLGK